MKDLYTAIQDHIYNSIPEVQWIDLWNNQLNNMDKEDPIPFPAAFVEFAPISWTRMVNSKKAQMIIRIHFVQECYASSFKGSANQAQALQILDNSDILDSLLEDFSADNCSPFTGTGMELDINHDMLIDTILEYQVNYTKVLGRKKVTVSPVLKVTATISA